MAAEEEEGGYIQVKVWQQQGVRCTDAANVVVLIWSTGSFLAEVTACTSCACHAIAGKRQTDESVLDRPLLSACAVMAPWHVAENYH